MIDAAFHLLQGTRNPYDGGKAFHEGEDAPAPPAADWAHAAARGVLHDLCDRRGIKWELQQVDHETRAELVASLAAIIRQADLDRLIGEKAAG